MKYLSIPREQEMGAYLSKVEKSHGSWQTELDMEKIKSVLFAWKVPSQNQSGYGSSGIILGCVLRSQRLLRKEVYF